jgi:hypothetical protein
MSVFYFIQDTLWRLNHRPDVLHLKSDCFLTQLLEEQVIFFLKIKQSCNPEKNKINRRNGATCPLTHIKDVEMERCSGYFKFVILPVNL